MRGLARMTLAVLMPLVGGSLFAAPEAARGQDQQASLEVPTRTDVDLPMLRVAKPPAAKPRNSHRHAARKSPAAKFSSDFAFTDYPMTEGNQPALSLEVDTAGEVRFTAPTPLPRRTANDASNGETLAPDRLVDGSTSASLQEFEQKSGRGFTLPLLRVANPEPQ